MNNHYQTLNVAETASDEEIKKAYRDLAKKHHPDRHKGDKDAEERFKVIGEAYSVLSDPNKRAEYDHIRKFGGNPFGRGSQQGFHFNFNNNPNFNQFDDIIKEFFNQQGFGGGPFANQQPRKNRDLQFGIDVTLNEAFTGKDLPLSFDIGVDNPNIVVKIPAGVTSGTRMRFQGYGDKTIPGIPPGDLYVIINVINHPKFNRDGPHLLMELQIDALDAITGCSQQIDCIDGSQILLNIRPGTQHGFTMRVQGKGMPAHHNAIQRGDLMVTVLISIPQNLNESHLNALKQIASERKGI